MVEEKIPPYDAEAEEAVIGSLLIDGDAMIEIAPLLKTDDFFIETNRWIYNACYDLFERHEIINQITVAHELAKQEKLEEAGGASYLSKLVSSVPTSLHIESYAKIVSRLSVMRRLIGASYKIASIGYEADPDVDSAISKAEDMLFQVRQKQTRGDFIRLRDVLDQYFEDLTPVTTEEGIPHILTGFTVLDDLLVGLQRSSLIILAARPSLGKSSLALNIARNAALNQKACVAIFSLEMSKNEIVQRLLSSEANVTSRHIRQGNYTEEEERRVMEASALLSEGAIFIDDSAQLRVAEIRSKSRRLNFERPIDLIIIDYLQLIKGESRSENRVQELSEITRSLKAIARELDVPVLTVSQLSRAVEMRISHKPQLSDLRDSGSIEQDADVVMFIHRDEKYYTEESWAEKHTDPFPRGIADVIIAKNRNGPVDEFKLQFIEKTTQFKNLEIEQTRTFLERIKG